MLKGQPECQVSPQLSLLSNTIPWRDVFIKSLLTDAAGFSFLNIKNITSVLNTFLDRMDINHPITFTRWSFMIGCNDRRGALTEIPCYHAARSLAFQTVSVLPQICLCCYTVCGSTFESIPGLCSDATTLPHPCCDNQTHLQILSLIPGGKTPSSWLLLYRAWYQLCGR